MMRQKAWMWAWMPAVFLVSMASGCNRGDGSTSLTASVAGGAGASSDVSDNSALAAPQENRHPVVRIDTTLGAITVELDADHAPITVKNFLWYTNNGFYDQTIFHQVFHRYVAVGGGYTSAFVEKPIHVVIRNEASTRLKNLRGTIAMARRPDVIDSSTCQFYFNLGDNSNLDQKSRNNSAEFGYCVFGKVIEGIEVLDKISAAPVADTPKFAAAPVTPIVIKSVTRLR